MRSEIVSHVVVVGSTPVYSQAVPTDGKNGISLDITVLAAYVPATDTILCTVEQSSDLQNWTPMSLAASVTGTTASFPAYTVTSTGGTATALSSGYVRIAFAAGAAASRACIAAGVNFFNFAT